MKVQFDNMYDEQITVEIDKKVFRSILTNNDGKDLIEAFVREMEIIERDPRQSELNRCAMTFPYNEIVNGWQTAAELLSDLDECPDDEPSSKKSSPESWGCSKLAHNIISKTFLLLDGFAALRQQMDNTDYTAEHFAAELARIADREIVSHLLGDSHEV